MNIHKIILSTQHTQTIANNFRLAATILSTNKFINTTYTICKSTIFNDPWTALGSHIKGPNNMIYREWAWKVWPWAQVSGLVVVPTGNTAWAGLAGLTKPSISKSSKTQALAHPPGLLFGFVSFSFYISVPFSFLCPHVNITFLGCRPV